MAEKNEVSLGFDIGISSVGWSVVATETGKILESGVRLFSGASAAKNEERRGFRQGRRLIRRRKNRLEDLKKYLKKEGFVGNFEVPSNPYEIRLKGLSEKLSKEEIAIALYHIAKRRGISYDLGDVEEAGTGSNYQQSLSENQLLLAEKTPAEIQLERLEKYGEVRGQVVDKDNQTILLNVFPTKEYEKEVRQILTQQQHFYAEIDDEFIESVVTIITRKREYYIGPGNEQSRTDYGVYRTDGTTLDNLFEILIGKDSIYPSERRAAGNSYTAQLFNLLNDLNNLRITGNESGKVTSEQKKVIINELKTTTSNVNMLKLIAKKTNTPVDGISGYRIDEKGKPLFHSFAPYRKIRKVFLTESIDINDWPTAFFDEFGETVTLNTETGEIRRKLEEELTQKYDFLTTDLIELLLKNKTAFSIESRNKWHRFSLRTMKELIPEMQATSKEQMTILAERGMLKQDHRAYQGATGIDYRQLSEEIYNPVVAKSVRESMKVFNALYEKYPHIKYIAIEMPREDDEDKARKNYQDFQKKNKSEKDAAFEEFKRKAGSSESTLDAAFRGNSKLALQIRLWYQQEGKCPYSGKVIQASDLVSNHSMFDIDHIIPQAVSYDDSINNKVLCYADMNRKKGKEAPYSFMEKGFGQGFTALIAMCKSNKHWSDTKKKNLLFKEDLADIETRKRFVARNLVDTRYASRVVLNELQDFVTANNMDTRVTVIRGKLTSTLRNHWNLFKTRETHHHHAVDAAIIAMSPMLNIWGKQTTIFPIETKTKELDFSLGDILDKKVFEEAFYELPKKQFKEDIKVLDSRIKFSHQVDKKMNRKVSDATIYATRNVQLGKDKEKTDYVIGKITNIYDQKEYEKFNKIYNKDKTKFLMFHHDRQTFEKLETIMVEYPDSKEVVQDNGTVKTVKVSPFELYRQDNGPVTKYAKKKNGPVIKQIKYYDSKLGSHVDITPENAKKTVVLQSLKPWRTDVYFNQATKQYEIMGIKYADLCFGKGGDYGVLKTDYQKIKKEEKVDDQSEFCFSLYRNDRIKVIDLVTNESVELLFGSRTKPASRGYVELKPVNKKVFDTNEVIGIYEEVDKAGRCIKKFTKENYKLLKINTDILGNPYYVAQEGIEPKNILD